MEGFSLPNEYEDFITSASDLLNQYKQGINNNNYNDFLIFRIFVNNSSVDTSLKDMISLREQIIAIITPMINKYMWHNDKLRIKIILPDNDTPIYLGGLLEYGDCVDDEWFVVSVLYEVSKKLTQLNISITDVDGEFLLIEASNADIPDWIGPENSENRVWIKKGQLHIIPIDETGRKRSGGIDVASALLVLDQACDEPDSTLAAPSAQDAIFERINFALTRNQAQLHHAAVTVPLKVAQLLTARPSTISSAVTGLNSEQSKRTNKIKSSMSYFGTSPLVTISATFTRALYAHLTFQERFHPPPKFLNAQRVLQAQQQREESACNDGTGAWDTASAKAFDIGCRIACGFEIQYQNALREEKQWQIDRQNRDKSIHEYLIKKGIADNIADNTPPHIFVKVPDENLSSETVLSNDICAGNEKSSTESDSALAMMNCFRPNLSFSEVVNRTLQDPPLPLSPRAKELPHHKTVPFLHADVIDDEVEYDSRIKSVQDIVIQKVLPTETDSDAWLYMTPDEFDSNMKSRMSSVAQNSHVYATDNGTESSARMLDSDDDDADGADIWKDHSPPSKAHSAQDGSVNNFDTDALSNVLSGMESFMVSYSDYSGVSKEREDREAELSDNDDKMEDEGREFLNDTYVTTSATTTSQAGLKEKVPLEGIDFNEEILKEILAGYGVNKFDDAVDKVTLQNSDVREFDEVDITKNSPNRNKVDADDVIDKRENANADDDDEDSFFGSGSDSDDELGDNNANDVPDDLGDSHEEKIEDYMEAYSVRIARNHVNFLSVRVINVHFFVLMSIRPFWTPNFLRQL